jgi:Predicted acyltransferases
MKAEKIFELDVLKSFAIVFIVACHMDNYLVYFSVSRSLDSYFAFAGLSLFFFLSGYAIYYNNYAINTKGHISLFYKKRLYRIYPLYWIALITTVIVFELLKIDPGNTSPYNIDSINFFVHMIGFQVFFPWYHIQSMWFVGTILLCYFLYPIIIYYSNNTLSILIIAISLITPFALLKLLSNLMTTYFFIYYIVFIQGILSSKINLFEDPKFHKYTLLCEITFLLFLFMYMIDNLKLMHSDDSRIISFVLPNVFILIFPTASYRVIKSLSYLRYERINSLVFSISYASYSIYLFQHPFLSILKMILTSLHITGLFADLSLLIVGLPVLFLLGYIIQKSFSRFLNSNHQTT